MHPEDWYRMEGVRAVNQALGRVGCQFIKIFDIIFFRLFDTKMILERLF